MTEPSDFFTYMVGTWHLERTISVTGNNTNSLFTGLAHIRPTDVRGTYSYHEEGSFVGEQVPLQGYRDYLYKVKDETLAITFADPHRLGQLYVTLNFSMGLIAQDTYLCEDDIYGHIFEIIHGDHFMTETTVSGPEKDYRLTTHYRRL